MIIYGCLKVTVIELLLFLVFIDFDRFICFIYPYLFWPSGYRVSIILSGVELSRIYRMHSALFTARQHS